MIQLELFDRWQDPVFLDWICTPCHWAESVWNPGEWYVYQDANGMTMSDDYGRYIHYGTMLPILYK